MNVCIDASPILLSGVIPSGGYYYGNSVKNDTFYPAQALIGENYAIYQFVDTATQCANTSELGIIIENCTGIQSPATGTAVSIYPNPASFSVTIQSDLPMLSIRIVNVLSETVREEKSINETTHEMIIGNLTDGTYMICIETAEGKIIKRLIKM